MDSNTESAASILEELNGQLTLLTEWEQNLCRKFYAYIHDKKWSITEGQVVLLEKIKIDLEDGKKVLDEEHHKFAVDALSKQWVLKSESEKEFCERIASKKPGHWKVSSKERAWLKKIGHRVTKE